MTTTTTTATERPSVPEWYRDRAVFVTGGSGYMGKVLIYKLLESCPAIGNVYMLIREKKGLTAQARIQKLMQTVPLQVIRERHPERLKKLVPVTGETTTLGLGLSQDDAERMQREVSVVFHMAANVRFDVSLKEAVKTNTEGTMNVLAFAKQLPRLESFVHVSTAYCQCMEPVLEERFYPTQVDPVSMINTVNEMPEEAVQAMTATLLKEQPNTYAFSKSLSEAVVVRGDIPTGVARPSIVMPSMKEPAPGWVENLNGTAGLTVGACAGVIRSVLGNGDYLAHVTVCDQAVNAIICLGWKVGLEKPAEPIFMNITQDAGNTMTWAEATEMGRKIVVEYPFMSTLWYPGGGMTTCKPYHYFRVVFFQYIPAYLLDSLLFVLGYKPFLIRVQDKVQAGTRLIGYYLSKDWNFETRRMKELNAEMTEEDRATFSIDTSAICWDDYMLTYILGCKKFCLKEDISNLPRARRLITFLYYLDVLVKTSLVLLLGWFLYSLFVPRTASINIEGIDV